MALGTIFLSTILLSFGVTLVAAGLLGAYFGKGRSRSMGFVLMLVAILLIGLFCALTWEIIPGLSPTFDPVAVGQSMIAVVAALLGTALAVVMFVASMMRS